MLECTKFCLVIAIIFQYCTSIELSNGPKLTRQHRIQKRQNNAQCSTDQFKCDSKCINQTDTCNGFFDCDDESDETWETCHNRVCSSSRFRCESGGCIHKNKLCDGFLSCIKGDDETAEICKDNVCSPDKFRCTYGGCIRKHKVCNGNEDCADGSDESLTLCTKVVTSTSSSTTTTTKKPISTSVKAKSTPSDSKQCTLPPITPDRTYTVTCPPKNSCGIKPGDQTMEYTILKSKCNPGFTVYQDGKVSSNINNNMISTCFNGIWSDVPKCKRICNDLRSLDLELKCSQYLHGPRIPCTGILLEGAAVIPACKPQYHKNFNHDYRHVICQKDGTWNKEFFQCSPNCGRTPSSIVNLIVNGRKETRGEAPWNVAVYSSENSKVPDFICGGTLISAELVVSAAHCYFNSAYQKKMDARLYTVIVGKSTLDFNKVDYINTTKKYAVREIYFTDTPFNGERTGYASDIAVLRLSDRIVLSEDVLPACVRWNEKDRFDPGGKQTFGKLSGFGVTQDGELSNELLTANLPYINFTECKRRVSEDFKDSISFDKFCAGNETGAGARMGDSGGGLVFKDETDGFFYLRGVVSNRESGESSIATFTDITFHITWIKRIVISVDRSAVDEDTSVNLKTKL